MISIYLFFYTQNLLVKLINIAIVLNIKITNFNIIIIINKSNTTS